MADPRRIAQGRMAQDGFRPTEGYQPKPGSQQEGYRPAASVSRTAAPKPPSGGSSAQAPKK